MAMPQAPAGRALNHHHFHVEFYPPNRTRDKLKYLAGSELGAGAFIVDARAEDKAAELREAYGQASRGVPWTGPRPCAPPPATRPFPPRLRPAPPLRSAPSRPR